jgi:hypothetical protein
MTTNTHGLFFFNPADSIWCFSSRLSDSFPNSFPNGVKNIIFALLNQASSNSRPKLNLLPPASEKSPVGKKNRLLSSIYLTSKEALRYSYPAAAPPLRDCCGMSRYPVTTFRDAGAAPQLL